VSGEASWRVTIPVNVLLLLVVAGVSSASCGEAGAGAHEQAHLGTDHPFFRLLRLSRVSPVPLTKEQMLTASEVIATWQFQARLASAGFRLPVASRQLPVLAG
jgi:hypothetical protein